VVCYSITAQGSIAGEVKTERVAQEQAGWLGRITLQSGGAFRQPRFLFLHRLNRLSAVSTTVKTANG
jgi:hypothetical protein